MTVNNPEPTVPVVRVRWQHAAMREPHGLVAQRLVGTRADALGIAYIVVCAHRLSLAHARAPRGGEKNKERKGTRVGNSKRGRTSTSA